MQARVPDEQAIEKMRVANPVRSRCRESVNRVLDVVITALYEIGNDEVAYVQFVSMYISINEESFRFFFLDLGW